MGSVASVLGLTEGAASGAAPVIDDVDQLRARHYDLLATLLGRAPDVALLDALRELEGGEGILGRHRAELSRAAATTSAHAVEREFFALFVGVGRGELLPYASYYLTGFLNERPLARVREDFAALGIERDETVSEPEDHLAILLDVMAGLAAGRFDAAPDMPARFFARHVAPWAHRFFADLEGAKAARFYRTVGALGRTFIEIETEAFAMEG
ncbi:TorD/DmsD family molecular chaperone [Methylorubrum salsuginis]|uniref:Chaperone TorD involved in molybdoenzyme TorA maturation n=1 Tax=Methylorubrum salsuginis TaxID=414703 RepID=A0A1I4FPR2_9HYPH|nr:molecular chaperone TorD family protein [Methylorubrum salsuginis]SFL19439.1 chaperone TorD involved in molybdoenzyme TorA maturation [Methylorubrum salsuginis]